MALFCALLSRTEEGGEIFVIIIIINIILRRNDFFYDTRVYKKPINLSKTNWVIHKILGNLLICLERLQILTIRPK